MPDRHTHRHTDTQTHTQLIWAEPSLERFGDNLVKIHELWFHMGSRHSKLGHIKKKKSNIKIHANRLCFKHMKTLYSTVKNQLGSTKLN